MAKHIHAEVIKAWAEGAEIEFRGTGRHGRTDWITAFNPRWADDFEYRVKPVPELAHPYRVYLYRTPSGGARVFIVWTEESAKKVQELPCFIRWLTDWETEEV